MEDLNVQIAALQERIESLVSQLNQAKQRVQEWTDASAALAQSAAEARAKNQAKGRGLGGAIFGAKYRSAMRSAAAASNAAIAKQVAGKRAKIAEGKGQAQERARQLQSQLSLAKEQLKSLTMQAKATARSKVAATTVVNESLTLLQKLKEAYDLGLLTEEEYQEKRQKLVAQI